MCGGDKSERLIVPLVTQSSKTSLRERLVVKLKERAKDTSLVRNPHLQFKRVILLRLSEVTAQARTQTPFNLNLSVS